MVDLYEGTNVRMNTKLFFLSYTDNYSSCTSVLILGLNMTDILLHRIHEEIVIVFSRRTALYNIHKCVIHKHA